MDDKILNKKYYFKFNNGAVYVLPMYDICLLHAESVGSNVMESLETTTLPFFKNEENIEKWVKGNLTWDDISSKVIQTKPPTLDYDKEFQESRVKII